jgi:enterochelin esterase-like enzyme
MRGSCVAIAALAALAATIVAPAPAAPQDSIDGEPVSIGTYREFRSEVLNEDRTLLVCLPKGYEDESLSYPALFVLYGDQVRGYFAEAVHVVNRLAEEGSIPRMIVVGVANVDRYRDLSPVGRRGNESGIGPFSQFVAEELIPFVNAEYRTKDFRVLLGPQAGAAFGLYALAGMKGLFDAFIIENPFRSAPVHDVLAPMAEALVHEGLPSFTFLQITCHKREGFLQKTDEVEFMRSFEKMVRESEPRNLKLVTHYPEVTEDFIPSLMLKGGLRELFRDYKFPADREVEGLEDITAHYEGLSELFGFDVEVPEMTLYSKAEELKSRGQNEAAMEILEYLIEVYPASVNGYWGLGNLHREMGNRELALKNYRKCLEIMPNMPPARHWIEKLEEER